MPWECRCVLFIVQILSKGWELVSFTRASCAALQEEEAMDSVVEEFKLQKVDISDVVFVTDSDKLEECVPICVCRAAPEGHAVLSSQHHR
jgi:hypothetical protein